MTELELIERARGYMEKLANGINPLDGSVIPDDDVVNQVKLSRCFFFVSDVLRRVVENGGVETKARKKKIEFEVPQEIENRFEYSNIPIPVSEITKRINKLRPCEEMKNLQYRQITSWLIRGAFLEEQRGEDGKIVKCPTPQGNELGITLEERTSDRGVYFVIVYNEMAQSFIISHLNEIIA